MGGVRSSSSAKAPRVVKKAATPVRVATPDVREPRKKRRLVRDCSGRIIEVTSRTGACCPGRNEVTPWPHSGSRPGGGHVFGLGYFDAGRVVRPRSRPLRIKLPDRHGFWGAGSTMLT